MSPPKDAQERHLRQPERVDPGQDVGDEGLGVTAGGRRTLAPVTRWSRATTR